MRLGDDAIRIGVAILAAVFSPLMGALLYAQIFGGLFLGV